MHDQPCYTFYWSDLGGQTRAWTKRWSLRCLGIIMSQALGNAYRSILEQHCRGRAGDLIKQTYCVWADRSMWPPHTPPHPPSDAMHFHSRTGCCTVQSGPGAGVNLFTSSAAETKEQWERWSEHSQEHIINPGDCAHRYPGKHRFFLFFFSWGGDMGWDSVCSLLGLGRVQKTTSESRNCCRWMMLHTVNIMYVHTLISPFHRSAARSRGWCRWAVQVVAKIVWSYS